MPHACGDHAQRCARLGLAMLDAVKAFHGPNGQMLELKIGVHSGNIISGVIGVLLPRFRYDFVTFACLYVCMYVCMYVCVCVCVCVCVYMHIQGTSFRE